MQRTWVLLLWILGAAALLAGACSLQEEDSTPGDETRTPAPEQQPTLETEPTPGEAATPTPPGPAEPRFDTAAVEAQVSRTN